MSECNEPTHSFSCTRPPPAQWLPKGAIPQLSAPCSLERLRRKGGGTLLDVPFDEKDDAKAAGARWDGDEKKLYVVEHASSFAAFERWLPLVE